MMHDEQERRKRHHEAAQHALERGLLSQESLQRAIEMGLLSPEQAQMAQAALQRGHQHRAGQPLSPTTPFPGDTGTPPMNAPFVSPLPVQTASPYAIPQSSLDPLYRNAVAELQRWLALYEKYQMQGSFAQLESIFQAIRQIPGR